MRTLLRDQAGNSVTEFAFLGPVFLMMIFLVLEGGRMLFTKQALNQLAAASARYAGVHPTMTSSEISTWTKARGLKLSRLSSAMVVTSTQESCNNVPGMAKVKIDLPYAKGAMNLLPQSAVPSTLTSTACFPVVT